MGWVGNVVAGHATRVKMRNASCSFPNLKKTHTHTPNQGISLGVRSPHNDNLPVFKDEKFRVLSNVYPIFSSIFQGVLRGNRHRSTVV